MPFKLIDVETLYKNDPKIRKEDVEALKEWLKKQPHLPEIKESQLILFLHSCYYSNEQAKICLDKYFTMRTHLSSSISRYLNEEDLRTALGVATITALPSLNKDKHAILLLGLRDTKPENFNFSNLIATVNMVAVTYLYTHGYTWGVQIIFDLKGVTFSHLLKFDLTILKNALDFVQTALPIRIKGISLINGLGLMDKVKILVKPFLSDELYNLLEFHSSQDGIYKNVPQELLPEEYGGKAPSIAKLAEENIAEILENYDLFPWHATQTVDESKRLDKSKSGDSFGVEGSFKKLSLD